MTGGVVFGKGLPGGVVRTPVAILRPRRGGARGGETHTRATGVAHGVVVDLQDDGRRETCACVLKCGWVS